jgi:hypothetical protein
MFAVVYRVVALRVLVLMAFIPVAAFWFGAKAVGLPEWTGLVALGAVVALAWFWRSETRQLNAPTAAAPASTPAPAVVAPLTSQEPQPLPRTPTDPGVVSQKFTDGTTRYYPATPAGGLQMLSDAFAMDTERTAN